MIAGKKRGYLYVRLRITRAFLADGISRRKERINQKNTGVITALLFSRWRVIGRGGRKGGRREEGEGIQRQHVKRARISRGWKRVCQTRANSRQLVRFRGRRTWWKPGDCCVARSSRPTISWRSWKRHESVDNGGNW